MNLLRFKFVHNNLKNSFKSFASVSCTYILRLWMGILFKCCCIIIPLSTVNTIIYGSGNGTGAVNLENSEYMDLVKLFY